MNLRRTLSPYIDKFIACRMSRNQLVEQIQYSSGATSAWCSNIGLDHMPRKISAMFYHILHGITQFAAKLCMCVCVEQTR